MAFIEQGFVRGGQIVLDEPLSLAEGTPVVVHVEPLLPSEMREHETSFASLPFFGMWADREEMADSAARVRKEREQWHLRAARQD
jgi:hypothetical protein